MQRTTPVVLNLIILNVLAYIAQQTISALDVTEWGSLHYVSSPLFKPHQLITHMFLHGGISHLLFNMFALWMFGSILENYISSRKIFGILSYLRIGCWHPYTTDYSI